MKSDRFIKLTLVVIAALLAANLLINASLATAKPAYAQSQPEYKVIWFKYSTYNPPSIMQSQLNAAAENGWELYDTVVMNGYSGTYFILKRQ